MSVKTSELSTTTSPKAANTLLMANSAGGTTQLSLENLAKFLAEQENAVKTVLDKVTAAVAPQRTVTVTAANLPAYIANLPRLLTEDLTINVSGTMSGELGFYGFYGPGALTVNSTGSFTINNGKIIIWDCSVFIRINGAAIGSTSAGSNDGAITVRRSPAVMLTSCTVNGNNANAGFYANIGSFLHLNGCSAKNCAQAVMTQSSSIITVYTEGTSDFSGNTYGARAFYGGIILLAGNTPETLGAASNVKAGGLIVNRAGNVI